MRRTLALALLAAFALPIGCAKRQVNKEITPLTDEQMPGRYRTFTDRDRLVILNYGDAGEGDEAQQRVADLMLEICKKKKGCDFALVNGDNIYDDGVSDTKDVKLFTHFEKIYQAFGRFDFWSVMGNHDWRTDPQAEINYTLESHRWRMPHGWYDVPGLPQWLSIFAMETTLIHHESELDAAAKDRLKQQRADAKAALCDGSPHWKLMFGHHFTYTSSQKRIFDDYSKMREFVFPVMRECGVQVVLSGHDHHLELLEIDKKAKEHPAYVQIISGAGGRHLRGVFVDELLPARPGVHQRFTKVQFGFEVLTITPTDLTIEFYTVDPTRDEADAGKPVYTKRYTLSDFEKDAL